MAHVKGAPKTGGRKKGKPNRTTVVVKAAIESAYAAAGGDTAFGQWANDNKTEFYTRILTRILPKELEVTGNPDKPLHAVIRWGDVEIPI